MKINMAKKKTMVTADSKRVKMKKHMDSITSNMIRTMVTIRIIMIINSKRSQNIMSIKLNKSRLLITNMKR